MSKFKFHQHSVPQPQPERLAHWQDLPRTGDAIIMGVVAAVFVLAAIGTTLVIARFFLGFNH